MSKYITTSLNINDIEVSGSNPRFIQIVLNEESAISELIKLDLEKMIKLFKSVKEKGFLPMTFYAFKEKSKIVLADGNRRLTMIKIIKNPELIPDLQKYKKLKDLCLNEGKNISLPNKVPCIIYEKWEDELFDVLSSLHITDESKSDWTPLAQYRMSKRHGGKKHSWMDTLIFYYDIDYVDNITNKKADVFNRFFLAFKFHKINIDQGTGEIFIDNAKEKLDVIIKKVVGNKVNTRTDSDIFQSITKEVFLENKLEDECSEIVNIHAEPIEIYESKNFDLKDLKIKIYNEKKKLIIPYTKEELEFEYRNPAGEIVSNLNSSETGLWKLKIKYKDAFKIVDILVKKKIDAFIKLNIDKGIVKYGTTSVLRKFIDIARDCFNNDITDKVKISPLRGSNLLIENDILSSDNNPGIYEVQYSYKDKDCSVSKILYVDISKKDDHSPLTGIISKKNLLSYGNGISILFDNTVSEVINEINSLDYNEYPNVISAVSRSLIELTFDKLHSKKMVDNKKDLIDKINEIIIKLKDPKTLERISKNDPLNFSYRKELNFLNSINTTRLNAVLNQVTHNVTRITNKDTIIECISVDIAHLLALINEWLK